MSSQRTYQTWHTHTHTELTGNKRGWCHLRAEVLSPFLRFLFLFNISLLSFNRVSILSVFVSKSPLTGRRFVEPQDQAPCQQMMNSRTMWPHSLFKNSVLTKQFLEILLFSHFFFFLKRRLLASYALGILHLASLNENESSTIFNTYLYLHIVSFFKHFVIYVLAVSFQKFKQLVNKCGLINRQNCRLCANLCN